MVVRDRLAVDRTILANERTLMSYGRTGLAFAVAGVSSMHFLEGLMADAIGAALAATGLLTVAWGIRRYLWYRRKIREALEEARMPGP
jgi:putative membrane protein